MLNNFDFLQGISLFTVIVFIIAGTWLFKNLQPFFKFLKSAKDELDSYVEIKKKVLEQHKEYLELKSALLSIIREKLFSHCLGIIQRKDVDYEEFESVAHLYAEYHNLGGNHSGDRLYKEVCDIARRKKIFDDFR